MAQFRPNVAFLMVVIGATTTGIRNYHQDQEDIFNRNIVGLVSGERMGWEMGIEPTTSGATVRCSAS